MKISQRIMAGAAAALFALCASAPLLAQDKPAATAAAAMPAAKPAVAAKSAAAPAKMVLPGKVTSVEGITEYKLANGLRVLLFPDPSKPTVTVNVTYLVGSRHENYGETGMAHLLEHLVFKGTPKNPGIDKEFNKRGMRTNGSTWLDRTNYFELFQASDDNLKWAIEMEADRMVNSFIAKKDLDSEMTVVRNEMERGENAPFSVLLKRMQSIAYDWHNYGNSIIGNRSDVENVKIENLQAFYRQYYQPDNAVLLVAGKFDESRTLAWIQASFGKLPKPKRELPRLWTVEPTQDGERSFMVRRKGDIQIVALGYKVPSALHSDSDAVGFINFMLTDSPTGRLHKALVETGKAAQIAGFPLAGMDSTLHLIAAIVKKGEAIEPVQAEMTRIVEEFYKNPPTAEELSRARKSFANDSEKVLNNHESIGVQMSEYIALGDWRLFFEARDAAESMTGERIKDVAAKYYRRDNRIVGQFQPEDNPQRAELPPAPTAADVLKDFKGKQATSTAEAFDPSQANIDTRTKRTVVDGIKVAMLAKKNRGETVNLSVSLHMGDEQSLFGKRAIARLAGAMLSRGTTRFTREQLADEFDKLKISGGVSGTTASLQTTREHLTAAIKLVAHVMKEPSFPDNEFIQLKKQQITGIESQKSDPAARGRERQSLHFNTYPKGDWRAAASLDESIAEIDKVTLADIKSFHRDFYGAAVAEIAIVGDFDEVAATKAIGESFAGWKARQPYQRVVSEFKEIAAVNEAIETPDKENAVFLARLNVNMRDDDADYPALYLANYILGGGAGLNSRLAERIRQKEGLSYGVGSQLNVGSLDRAGSWSVYAIAAPQNVAKVEAAFKDELGRALKDGFLPAEIAAAKSGALQQRLQQRAQDGVLAGNWTGLLYTNRTFAFSKQFEDKIAALKAEDLMSAMKKHLDPAKVTIIKAGDFGKATKATAK
ncbi:MAG: pitrilysin family protein [Betaproteobacteria bacterium]